MVVSFLTFLFGPIHIAFGGHIGFEPKGNDTRGSFTFLARSGKRLNLQSSKSYQNLQKGMLVKSCSGDNIVTIVSKPQVFQVFFFGQIPDSGMFRYQVFQVFFFGQIPETPKTQITCKITN